MGVYGMCALMPFSTWGIPAIVTPIIMPLEFSIGANPMLTMGAVTSGAVLGSHACFYSDATVLTSSCRKICRCRIWQAVITPSCGLKSKYIIHVMDSGWYSGTKTERQIFAGCYKKSLYKAYSHNCRSIANPLMFSGEYHLPRAQALEIVCRVAEEFEAVHPEMDIYLVLYRESIYTLAEKNYSKLKSEKA